MKLKWKKPVSKALDAGANIIDSVSSITNGAKEVVGGLTAYATNFKHESMIDCAKSTRKMLRKLIKKHGAEEAKKIMKIALAYEDEKKLEKVFDNILAELKAETEASASSNG